MIHMCYSLHDSNVRKEAETSTRKGAIFNFIFFHIFQMFDRVVGMPLL